MSSIDVDQLLREVSPDAPCGPDLEYDAAFMEMTRAAAGKPAQSIGDRVIPGEDPNWRAVREQCLALSARTKDLRVAVLLAQSLAHTDGLAGFTQGLAFARGLVERYWTGVHPALDPDDRNDPTMRVNVLAGLASPAGVLAVLRNIPLAQSRRLGKFGLRDVEIANGTLPRPADAGEVPEQATIDAAFLDMDHDELQRAAAAAAEALVESQALEAALSGAVGSVSGADLTPLHQTLKRMNVLLQAQLGRRGLGTTATPATSSATPGTTSTTEGAPTMSGPIQSREDVIRVLDQLTDWYGRNEPSSPVPLLLQRAKRLVNKNFLEAVQDLTPSGVTEAQSIAGLNPQS